MSTSTAMLMEALPSLSPEVLRELRNKADFLLKMGSGTSSSKTEVADAELQEYYTALSDQRKRHLGESFLPLPTLKKGVSAQYRKVQISHKAVTAFLNKHAPNRTRIETIRMHKILANLAFSRASEINCPCTVNFTCSLLCDPAALIDHGFPGYLQSNLVSWILGGTQVSKNV